MNKLYFLIIIVLYSSCFLIPDEEEKLPAKIKIGTQEWMTKNLDVARYNNGDSIPYVPLNEKWQQLKTGAWCYYLNDSEYGLEYSKLYNWYAITDPRGIAPQGFRIPTQNDIDTLFRFLCGESKFCGGHLKATTDEWFSPNTGATNLTGFNALPAGSRKIDGQFTDLGLSATFWTSTEVNDLSASMYKVVHNSSIFIMDYDLKGQAFSVRCIGK
jgi:uncharacterized protein (TIGR02145 family)